MREAVGNLVEWWIWLRCEKWWFSSVAIESRKVYLKLCRWLRRESGEAYRELRRFVFAFSGE